MSTSMHVERVVDLLDPGANRLHSMTVEAARERVLRGTPEAVRAIDGSFALVARDGERVRLARSLDRPLRYFLAKRTEGPALVVADRIDVIRDWLESEGLGEQFHPSYTRMVPAHHVVEIRLVGCPDPEPTCTRFFAPRRNRFGSDLDEIGSAYVGALAQAIAKWLDLVPEREPIGVCFSGGVDSGAILLVTQHVMLAKGMSPARLKAFTLDLGGASDRLQAKEFLDATSLGFYLEPIVADPASIDLAETIRIVEDYKPRDVEAAAMVLALCAGIRERYPEWRYLIDGDGGDENLKDYPIEENPELTLRSVVSNLMLYHEGWGVGSVKHSLTYSGGLSRGCTRTYAPTRRFGFSAFSPFTQSDVVEVAEGIPFTELAQGSTERLYAIKGEVVRRGVRAVTGIDMPVFPKRRFQHGALGTDRFRTIFAVGEAEFRRRFLAIHDRAGDLRANSGARVSDRAIHEAYPLRGAARDRWILSKRGERRVLDPMRPYAFLVEEERTASGEVVDVATIFLTNRECPWRCVFCDLWKETLDETVPAGAIPAQIDLALGEIGRGDPRRAPARQLKLYNNGSFFDAHAVPPADHAAIAERARGFERVVVECHPALVGDAVVRFRDLLGGSTALEVAMGLETAHPEVLARLNKRMTLEQFDRAASLLESHDVSLRVFNLVKPPFITDDSEALHWAKRSLDFAFDCGATVASLIPTRGGNGALDALMEAGEFAPPSLALLERAADYGVGLGRGRAFADLWDLERFSECAACFPERAARLGRMNLVQSVEPPIECAACGAQKRGHQKRGQPPFPGSESEGNALR